MNDTDPLKAYLSARGKAGGSAKSEKKSAASRANIAKAQAAKREKIMSRYFATKLYNLPTGEFEAGSELSNAITRAGFVNHPKKVISDREAWSMTLQEFLESIQK